jgi:transposase
MSKDAPTLLKLALAGIDPITGIDPSLPQDLPGCHAIIRQQQILLEGLQHQVRELQRRVFGKSSEKLIPEPVVMPSPSLLPPVPLPAAPAKKPNVTPHGRRVLPADLPRKRIVHDLAENQKPCPCCGKMRKVIGEEVAEKLEFVPASLQVLQIVQIKYACDDCEQAGLNPQIELAEKPASPIEKGLAGPGLLAYVIVSKYGDHLPLNRLEKILERHKIQIARSTMCDWVAQSATALEPLYNLMVQEVKAGKVIHTDDTPVDVLDEKVKHSTRTGRLWVYVGNKEHPQTVFSYTPDRSRDGPMQFLKDWSGYLQADAYAGYNAVYAGQAGGKVIEVACWAHARRKFFDARDSEVAIGTQALGHVRLLYDVEDQANQAFQAQAKDAETRSLSSMRQELRQRLAVPRLQQFKAWLQSQQIANGGQVMSKSPMGQAITYALNQWDALCVYTTDGDLSIDNNISENALRRVALGRNNWTFLGSDAGGKTAAIHFSLIASCQRHEVNPLEYLKDVLDRIASTPISQLVNLLPSRWKPHADQSPAN